MLISRRTVLALAAAIAAASVTHPSWAEEGNAANYPNKPMRMIVGFAAGGGNDLFARLVGQKLAEVLGQPVVIENKPGAGGRLAMEYAMGSPPTATRSWWAPLARWRSRRRSIRSCRIIRPGLYAAQHDRLLSADPRRPHE